MNGFMFQDLASLEKGTGRLYLEFVAGASGAVPATLVRSKGIRSVVLTSTGLLTVNLSQPWSKNFFAAGSITQASLSAVTGLIVTPAAASTVTSTTAPKLVFNMLAAAGTAANMAVGDVFRMWAVLGNLSL
jgi:hypothetical protein